MTGERKQELRLWIELLRASNIIKKDLDARLRVQFGQSLSRFDVLSALDRADANGLRASEISQFLLVTDGATSQLTAHLVKEGLVERTPCPDDRRSAIFRLTPSGRALFARMAQQHGAWVSEHFERLSTEDIDTMKDLVRLIEPTAAAQRRAGNEKVAAT
ncbi:MAG: MarR family transcriptional regulator [Erythrobacter sp.]|nr:MarR family transcriptional regulator [Erythrobacter sp.]